MAETTLQDLPRNEQDLYRRLSKRMRRGLKQIYKEISTASAQDAVNSSDPTTRLFHEASAQLSEVLSTTQSATERIMDIVERHMDNQVEARDIIEAARRGAATPEQVERLAVINGTLGGDLAEIMTALSFQDLTGQRIKKVVGALEKIERTVVELYVSSGLIMEGSEKNPHTDLAQLEEEAQEAAHNIRRVRGSELRGPVNGVSQANINDLLAQLGMD